MSAPIAKPSPPKQAMVPPKRSFLRERITGIPAWVLVVELFIGLGWLRAAVEKIIDSFWWDGSTVAGFSIVHSLSALHWYRPVLDHFVVPASVVVAAVVLVAQLIAAGTLLSGRFVGVGLGIGIFLNLNFMLAGTVNPSVFYILAQGCVVLWMVESSPPGRRTPTYLSAVAVVAFVLGVFSIPGIQTLDPAYVIEDPGIMVTFVAVLTIVGCDLAHRRVTFGRPLAPIRWVKGGRRSASAIFAPETRSSSPSTMIDLSDGTGTRFRDSSWADVAGPGSREADSR